MVALAVFDVVSVTAAEIFDGMFDTHFWILDVILSRADLES